MGGFGSWFGIIFNLYGFSCTHKLTTRNRLTYFWLTGDKCLGMRKTIPSASNAANKYRLRLINSSTVMSVEYTYFRWFLFCLLFQCRVSSIEMEKRSHKSCRINNSSDTSVAHPFPLLTLAIRRLLFVLGKVLLWKRMTAWTPPLLPSALTCYNANIRK